MNFQMNQAAVFHLRRIAALVKAETGDRYRLANHGQIATLVRTASLLDTPELQGLLKGFYQECWPETQKMIAAKELIPEAHRLAA